MRQLKENIKVGSKCRLSTGLKIWLADEAFSNQVLHKNFTVLFFVRMQYKPFSLSEKVGLADETSSRLKSLYFRCLF